MILEKIRQTYPQLSKSQKRLADLVVNAYQEAAFMTASRMAKRAGVNEATVIRFAQRLGYPGFPEMVRDIQAVVCEELKTPAEAGVEAPLLRSLSGQREALERLLSHVSREQGERAMAALRGKRRVFVTGEGVSYWLAGAFAAELKVRGCDGRVVPGDALSLAQALAEMGQGDALVGIAAAGDSPELARALAVARQRGVPTLAVAWSSLSAIAQASDVALSCQGSEPAPLHAVGTVAALLGALAQALVGEDPSSAQRFATAVDAALASLRA